MLADFYYYTEACNSSKENMQEISENFVLALNSSQYNAACIGVPECDARYVNITCGSTTSRRKRHEDAAIVKRQVVKYAYKVQFELSVPFQPANGQSDTERFIELEDIMFNMLNVIKNETQSGHFDIAGYHTDENSVRSRASEYACPHGTVSIHQKASCGKESTVQVALKCISKSYCMWF